MFEESSGGSGHLTEEISKEEEMGPKIRNGARREETKQLGLRFPRFWMENDGKQWHF